MKKKYWIILIIVILIISPFIFLTIFYTMFPFFPPLGSCKWRPIEDFGLTVSNEEEAANLINEWVAIKYPPEYIEERWKNLTAKEIYLKENEFFIIENATAFWRTLKVDRNGKILSYHCPI